VVSFPTPARRTAQEIEDVISTQRISTSSPGPVPPQNLKIKCAASRPTIVASNGFLPASQVDSRRPPEHRPVPRQYDRVQDPHIDAYLATTSSQPAPAAGRLSGDEIKKKLHRRDPAMPDAHGASSRHRPVLRLRGLVYRRSCCTSIDTELGPLVHPLTRCAHLLTSARRLHHLRGPRRRRKIALGPAEYADHMGPRQAK